MILVELEIEDYKQFAGNHRFTPSSEGVIAIIGHNGAGKTTLFEAIEWCLYQPREIAADEVPPRGQVARPRVKLTLMDPTTEVRYVVSRSLSKSKVADAEIYREDEAETRIVKGSRQTTEYVSRTLIGLGHRAFVSTFFTRQKELTFFGDLKETERRREVGRLLGMETIRDAQKLIGDERTSFQAQAKALELQYREQSQDRDFAAETTSSEAEIEMRTSALASATQLLATAEATHASARAEFERVSGVERSDAEIRTRLETIGGQIKEAEANRTAALAQIERIAESERERPKLELESQKLPLAREAVLAQESRREQHRQASRLREEISRAQKESKGAVQELQRAVSIASGATIPNWEWRAGDEERPIASAQRLVAAAAALDPEAMSIRVRQLNAAATLGSDLFKKSADIERYREALSKFVLERDELQRTGPEAALARLRSDRDSAQEVMVQSESRSKSIAADLVELEPAMERLSAPTELKTCPTCGQPVSGEDLDLALRTMRQRISDLAAERARLGQAGREAKARLAEIDKEIEIAQSSASHIVTLNDRIKNGEKVIEEAATARDELQRHLASALSELRLTSAPLATDLEAASRELSTVQRVHGSLALLRRLAATLEQSHADDAAASQALAALGDATYSEEEQEQARAALSIAEQAHAQLTRVLGIIASRAQHEQAVSAAELRLAGLQVELEEANARRAQLSFVPAALDAARNTEVTALAAERAARDNRARAERELAAITKAHEDLLKEHNVISKLIERAEARARSADQLDLMYREFNAFEQFVADRLTPQLSDYTSELLSAITEGKYDRVELNSNYGIEVFDGDDEKFPVEEFSGGERDVIALSARLALSRLIGSQANNPPGFMVLDEVFGSLDRERRTQVLEMMGALAGTADAFHQLFIISHVDDVRSSPIFNEVWRVSEGLDGISHLENLNLTGGFDDT